MGTRDVVDDRFWHRSIRDRRGAAVELNRFFPVYAAGFAVFVDWKLQPLIKQFFTD
jgi:hypothetical protein